MIEQEPRIHSSEDSGNKADQFKGIDKVSSEFDIDQTSTLYKEIEESYKEKGGVPPRLLQEEGGCEIYLFILRDELSNVMDDQDRRKEMNRIIEKINRVTEIAEAEAKKKKITPFDRRVVDLRNQGRNNKQIAEELDVEKSTVMSSVRRLIDAGIIESQSRKKN